LLPPAVQIETLNRLLHRDLSNPLHNTNLHLHHFVTYGMGHTIPIVHDAGAGGCRASKTNRPSFFAMNPSVKFAAKDPSIHRDITVKDVLEKKLRWVTLGGQYNWTAKRYPTEKPPPFPADIRQLIGQIFSDIDPQAAILNLYTPGDTLSVHRDVSEECDQALVSISIGCEAIFIIGNEDGSNVAALWLRSGDAICMTGSSRFAWHAVPKVLPNTCPTWLRDWPALGSERPNFETWRGWIANKRINLNVRQMTAS
jgi:DNA alkylation damage repair protein AlkB